MLDDRGEIQAHVLGVHGRLTAAKRSRRGLLRFIRRWCSLCYRFNYWFSGSLNSWLCSCFGNYRLWCRLNNRRLCHSGFFNDRDLFSHWSRFGHLCHFGSYFDSLLKDRIEDLTSLSALLAK